MIALLLKALRWIKMSYRTVTNQWVPEIKRLNDQLEKLQDSLAGTDDCVVDIFNLEEKLENKMTYLEEDLVSVKKDSADLKDHLNTVIKELDTITNGGIETKLESLEEEIMSIKVQNIELRNHFNSTLKQLNAVTALINEKYDDLIEQTYELDSPFK